MPRNRLPLVRVVGAAAAGAIAATAATVLVANATGGAAPTAPATHLRAVPADPGLASATPAPTAGQRLAAATWARAAAAADAGRGSVWDSIAACETQGNWSMRGGTYSGGLGFANSAWAGFGGLEFAPNAGMATREQQITVAERIRSAVGLGAWGCARRLGLT